ncbi:MAG: ATP-binding protein [Firmicutes bacterium]|nr:ATP-binding protein [Bacillota bacterium]
MFELILAEILFTHKLRKKKHFALRAFGAIGVCLAAAFFYPIFNYSAVYSSIMFLALFAVTLPMLKLCYNESWKNLIFCAIAAYTVKHFAYAAESLLLITFNISAMGSFGQYGSEISIISYMVNPWGIFVYCVSYALVFWLAYVFFASTISKKESLKIDNFRLTVLSGGIILTVVVLNAVITYYAMQHYDTLYVVIILLYSILCCLFVLLLQFGFLNRQKLKDEIVIMRQLWAKEQEQYQVSKKNINLINMKCHDLKHFIRQIGEKSSLDKEALSEIEDAINIYDTSVQTGNETLDILLAEKSLFCLQNNIKLSCVADGSKLSFMTDADIYSLFGNAVENAIESVQKISDPDKRVIGIVVKSTGKFISIHMDNYFTGKLTFSNDIPVTTKKNKAFHGWGFKSMQYIVEKYGGDMSVFIDDDIFNLNILFSINEAE